ncbi:MAG: hypothetical protein R6U44_07425 [Archaeoglobaceae archaeon]
MPLIKFVDNYGREMALIETLMSRQELESEYQNFLKESGEEFGLDSFIRYLREKDAPIIAVHQLPVDHTIRWDLCSEQTG